jgi:hypothetical protein
MSTANLVSLERAKLNLPDATSADERTIDALIGACSAAIQKFCRRHFALRFCDELVDGHYGQRLLLREHPIHAVESVRHSPRAVLQVTNSDTALNQQARVTVTATGLTLVRVASGTRAVDTSVTWSANATVQAVATAVNALGNGWSARTIGSATGDYGLWPAQDLYIPPPFGDADRSEGAFDCRGRWAGLVLHTGELAGYCWDARGWLYHSDPWAEAAWPTHDGACPWFGGPGHWRVQYVAGYAEVPAAVQEACAEWVAELFWLTRRDGATASLAAVGSLAQAWVHERMPARVRGLLAPYRRMEV